MSLENEIATWKYIDGRADAALAKYPNTLEEDNNILERDSTENFLGFNKRNCVIYRKGEKELLYYLKDCAEKVSILV